MCDINNGKGEGGRGKGEGRRGGRGGGGGYCKCLGTSRGPPPLPSPLSDAPGYSGHGLWVHRQIGMVALLNGHVSGGKARDGQEGKRYIRGYVCDSLIEWVITIRQSPLHYASTIPFSVYFSIKHQVFCGKWTHPY